MKFFNLLNALKVRFKTAWQSSVMKGSIWSWRRASGTSTRWLGRGASGPVTPATKRGDKNFKCSDPSGPSANFLFCARIKSVAAIHNNSEGRINLEFFNSCCNMLLFFKSPFLSATLALLTAHVSAHSLVKRKVTGDKLYVLFNRSSCVTVQSDDAIMPVQSVGIYLPNMLWITKLKWKLYVLKNKLLISFMLVGDA